MKLVIIDFNKTLYDPFAKRIYPGSKELLESLKQRGAKVVLYSTGNTNREELISELGLNVYFNLIQFVTKKTTQGIKSILGSFKISAQEAMLIGDDPKGELAIGVALGIKTLAVGTGFCTPQKARQMGIAFFSSITELNIQSVGDYDE